MTSEGTERYFLERAGDSKAVCMQFCFVFRHFPYQESGAVVSRLDSKLEMKGVFKHIEASDGERMTLFFPSPLRLHGRENSPPGLIQVF